MTPEKLAQIRWLRSAPTTLDFESARVDSENGILYDVVMVQEGEAKGHGFHMEAEFISDLVAFDRKVFGERGVKARLGHPGMSDNTQGTQMGFFRNIRERKKKGKMQAIGDLHLLEASNISPSKPDMRDWVLSMAVEAPDFIMSSIVFRPGRYYQRAKDGKKKYVYEYTKVKGDDGSEYDKYVYPESSLGKVFIEFGQRGEHYNTDLVEDGAATDHLFSNQANPHLFVAQLGEWLDDHPDIRTFIQQNPAQVQAFLERAGIQQPKPKPALKMGLKEILFGKDKVEDDATITPEEINELRTNLAKADQALKNADEQIKALGEELKALKSGLAETEKQRDALNAKVEELNQKAADVHTKLQTETTDTGEEKSWSKDPINQRAAKAYSPKKKVGVQA